MTTVLVLGSNSFSGASFIKYLLEKEINVIGASRSPELSEVFLPYKWLPEKVQKRFQFHRIDLNHDLAALERLICREQTGVIVNFAAQSMVGESWDKPDDWMQTNVVAAARLAERLRHLDFLEKYVHVTTPEVYGSTNGWVDESTYFNPSTPYAVSRAAGDMLFKIYRETFGLPVLYTRAANVYGPGQPLYRIIPRAIYSMLTGRTIELHGGGKSTRSFIHINDVSEATWRIACDGSIGETYHISTDRVISIRDLIDLICQKLNFSFEDFVVSVGDRLGKDDAYWLNSAKLRSNLNWRDTVSLEEGLDETVDWAQKNVSLLQNESFKYIHKP